MFLNISLLEDVGRLRLCLRVRCLKQILPRSRNNYVTSILVLLMLAAVCESDSLFSMCTNIDYAVWGLCGDSYIYFGSHG